MFRERLRVVVALLSAGCSNVLDLDGLSFDRAPGATAGSGGAGGHAGTTGGGGNGGAAGSGGDDGPCVAGCTTFPVPAPTIIAGDSQTCALRADTTAECWGQRVGVGAPSPVLGLITLTEIAAGARHSCAVRADQAVWCWGNGSSAQLGDGMLWPAGTQTALPVEFADLNGSVHVAAGETASCVVLENGEVVCAGGVDGLLADEPLGVVIEPSFVRDLTDAVQIAIGARHVCALLESGRVECWGSAGFLGIGSTDADSWSGKTAVPNLVSVVQLVAGYGHTCALLRDGSVRCWGAGASGQLGNGTFYTASALDGGTAPGLAATPVVVTGLQNAIQISAGQLHSCALLTGGKARCWGSGRYGQLGDGLIHEEAPYGVATPVDVMLDDVAEIAAGAKHSCAKLADDSVWCWGEGWLGDGQTLLSAVQPTPVRVLASQ